MTLGSDSPSSAEWGWGFKMGERIALRANPRIHTKKHLCKRSPLRQYLYSPRGSCCPPLILLSVTSASHTQSESMTPKAGWAPLNKKSLHAVGGASYLDRAENINLDSIWGWLLMKQHLGCLSCALMESSAWALHGGVQGVCEAPPRLLTANFIIQKRAMIH